MWQQVKTDLSDSNVALDRLIDDACSAAPLSFLRQFLRDRRGKSRQVAIGSNSKQARENLRNAVVANLIGYEEVREWISRIEGWGRQHLYMHKCGKSSLALPQLLNPKALTRHLQRAGVAFDIEGAGAGSEYRLSRLYVDDELARLTWVSFENLLARRPELDEVRESDDGDYELHAYERQPTRSLSQLVIRKTDGVVLVLLNLPLGEAHTVLLRRVLEVAGKVLAPDRCDRLRLSGAVTKLDERAVSAKGPKASRNLSMTVSPTHARYRTDGARIDFRSTADGHGYTEVDAARAVRSALVVEKFVGVAGRFRLRFEGANGKGHEMVVSLDAMDNRVFLFATMTEVEVFALADQLLVLI